MQNTNLKTLKTLALNESTEVTKGSLKQVEEAIKELSASNAAYSFSISQKSARIYTVTRVLPQKLSGRAAFFDTITKATIKRAIKENGSVKTKAAAALGMSPRTFRRKLAEFNLSY
jgi:transcriptional regulator with GAF, ATPase, and Fis domain